MVTVIAIIAIFALLAYDIAANHGAWSREAINFVDDAWRGLRP